MEESDTERNDDSDLKNMEDPLGTKSTIKRVDKGTVHNICSGQVITSLRSAVKELVENSLDAGATSVEVHLCDHGTTSIEVIDNGGGIRPEDFEAVGLKHHTSKLREFADLPGVGTFGFRGEALGSLCALADVSMVTRHSSAPVATRLKFDINGRISEQTPAARQVGTTVTVRQLFGSLPVRRRQFCGRARREVTDLLQLLWGYALVVGGVRLLCTQQSSDGRRSVLLSSPAGGTLSDRVTALFGQKQTASLLPLGPVPPSEERRAEFGLGTAREEMEANVEGLVSSCEHGKGRSATDRQFIAINGRPCDHNKISRLVNEVYRGYNRHQSPFLVLLVALSRQQVDVNVTPDKRLLFIQNEKYLLACVKESLVQCFESLPSSYRVAPLSSPAGSVPPAASPSPLLTSSPRMTSSSPSGPAGDWISVIKRSAKKTAAPPTSAADSNSKRQCLDRFFRRVPDSAAADGGSEGAVVITSNGHSGGGGGDNSGSPEWPPPLSDYPPTPTATGGDSAALADVRSRLIPSADCTETPAGDPTRTEVTVAVSDTAEVRHESPTQRMTEEECRPFAAERLTERLAGTDCLVSREGGNGVQSQPVVEENTQECPVVVDLCGGQITVERDSLESPTDSVPVAEMITDDTNDISVAAQKTVPGEFDRVTSSDSGFAESSQDGENLGKSSRKRARLPFSMAELRRQVAELESNSSKSDDRGQEWRFRAAIKPSDNSAAEEELNLQIKKEDFLEMRVVGQFNLGFLVAQLGDDLFLIDQHATDEKYNFERLSRQPLSKQPLVVPQDLDLPVVSEETLLSHPEVFSEAGFHVTDDPAAPPGRRLRLLAAPAVQGVVCGKSDLEELIWLVQESTGTLAALRPSRVRSVLASRACRTSVMIGTALSQAGMTRLVHHMAEMEHPWNCPHGRPTMRHLVCLNMLQDS